MPERYTLYTMQNSPYSDKIRALLHYKKLDVVEHVENADTRFSVLQARTGKTMVPVILTPDDRALNDSTAIAAEIERAVPRPPTRWKDPETDTVAMLLEDYADEWLVRIMLCSRWYHATDAAQNTAIIACGMTHGVPGLDFQRAAREFPPGIVSNLPKMGATPGNAEQWYAMLPRILSAISAALARSLFLTGSGPHLLDFAVYGQLNQVRRDPTGSAWIAEGPAAVREWLERLEAAFSGNLDAVPVALDDLESLAPLVEEMASTYLRMQVANTLALESGASEVVAPLGGGVVFLAPPAKYSARILAANLDLLESLYGAGMALPGAIEFALLRELAPLASARSPILESRPALAAILDQRR